jgi:hypothetical protein
MPLYRFYRITSTEGPEEYIGSTTQTIEKRFIAHRTSHNCGRGVSSSILFTKYGVDTCSISLISEQEMEKADALVEEGRLIQECLTAVNQRIPVVDREEHHMKYKEYHHKYRMEHREEAKESNRMYREGNDVLKEKKRTFYQEHREAIRARQAERISCDVCGKIVTRGMMGQHKKRKSCVPPSE